MTKKEQPFTFKFRAWDDKHKFMAYEGTPDLETLSSFMHHYGNEKFEKTTTIGIKDKNGKDIYCGDIVKWKGYFNKEKFEHIAIVSWKKDYCGYVLVNLNKEIKHAMPIMIGENIFEKDLEVIGNFWKNKELLK